VRLYASAVYVVTVSLSVTVQKWLNLGSRFLLRTSSTIIIIIIIITPYDSPEIVVFRREKSQRKCQRNSNGVTPNGCAKYSEFGGSKFIAASLDTAEFSDLSAASLDSTLFFCVLYHRCTEYVTVGTRYLLVVVHNAEPSDLVTAVHVSCAALTTDSGILL